LLQFIGSWEPNVSLLLFSVLPNSLSLLYPTISPAFPDCVSPVLKNSPALEPLGTHVYTSLRRAALQSSCGDESPSI